MRKLRGCGLVVFVFFLAIPQSARCQQPLQSIAARRDLQAITVLQESLAAMGGSFPSDAVLTGSITSIAGSTVENGTIRILTRGLDQSLEQIVTDHGSFQIIRSKREAEESKNGVSKRLPLERVVTSHTCLFPLLAIARALNDLTTQVEYVGLEVVDDQSVHHLRLAETFADPHLRHLTDFSRKDLWIDSKTFLPARGFEERRQSRGPVYPSRLEITFSGYRVANGFQYASIIQTFLNGTHYQTIRIDALAINTGLSDNDFPVKKEVL